MVRDAVRAYWGMASGLTEVTRQRAVDVAKQLVAQGEATAGQTKGIAEELLATGRSNRDAVVQLVRYEVDRAMGRIGLAGNNDVEALSARVRALEAQLREVTEERAEPKAASTPKTAPDKKAPVKKAPVKKAPVKKAAVKKAAVKKAAVKKAAVKKAAVKKAAVTKKASVTKKAARR